MSGYAPLYISGNQTGLVQNRQNFLIPNDAYPTLENAYIFREQIRRKQAYQLLGRLRRVLTGQALGNLTAGSFSGNIISILSLGSSSEIQVGSVVLSDGANTFTDNSHGVLVGAPAGSGTINYVTGAVTITGGNGNSALTAAFNYYPNLPVMGLRTRDLNASNSEMTVAWDTKYAYNFSASGWVEFIPGTTWSSGLPNANSNFFWTTNYWVDKNNVKIFWATNDSGTTGDPIRYTNGVGNGTGAWIDFAPQIDAAVNRLQQCLIMVPFRARLIAFNTLEGATLGTSTSFSNRIRWAAIGNPFADVSSIVTAVNANAWRDDIRGQGGYLNVPTNEDIIAVGFVRDNLVIYCENSTWQLRYTGRTISPFQIEKVNTELGASSTFSAVQFDTSLVGIGDKGVVECDSVKSQRIDIKIPDLVMEHFNNNNNGQKRVYGIRDFLLRTAYWTYPESDNNGTFPDRRLVYNYENDSWAIFTDSLTCLGTFQPVSSRTWANPTGSTPDVKLQWKEANFAWGNKPSAILSIIGGNQQGYVEYLDQQTTNDASLTITAITGNTTTPTQITSVNHNMQTGYVISINQIPTGTPFSSSLNGNIFGIVVNSANTFLLMVYNPSTGQFSSPQLDAPAAYIGGGQISVRDNFMVTSKQFNFMEQGQNIQIGYIDILANTSEASAITLNTFVNYNDDTAVNEQADPFFNTIIPTSASSLQSQNGNKTMQRVYCPTRGNFITLQYTLSNAQMNGLEQENDVQIDSQIVWQRPAGRVGFI